MKKQVLHFIPSLGGGGAERQLANLSGGLRDLGWELHVAYVRPGPNLERLRAGGAILHPLSAIGNQDPRLLWQVYHLIRKVKPSLVQTWITQMDILGGLAARIAGCPWVLAESSSAQNYPPTPKHRVRKYLARQAAAIVSNSASGDQYWAWSVGKGVPGFVIRNGLPLEELGALPPISAEESGVRPDQKVVLFAGRFMPVRNLENFVIALREVRRKTDMVAIVCGEGLQRPELENWIREEGLADHVRLMGYLPERELWRWMKRADVFLSISLYEGQPNAVLEAMVCGCPLVVSSISQHREFLDTTSAWLVNPRAPGQVAAAIGEVFAHPEEARARAARARARAAQWTIAGMARQYEQVYLDVLARTKGIEGMRD